ncbi:MAG: PQQ-binding-like beta-propeller repeat protein [Armatimonadia bacterium]
MRVNRPFVMALLLAATACALSVEVSAEDWPTLHLDAARSGVSAEPQLGPTLEVAWATTVDPESVDASPAVVQGRVYVGTALGKVVCLAAETGEKQWEAQTGGAVTSSPAVAEGKVFVGSSDRCLYGYDAQTGKQLWRVRTRQPVVASPLYLEGFVYFGSMDGSFRCVRAADGTEVWRAGDQGPISAAAAAFGGLVYYGDESGNLIARSCPDGKLSWSSKVSGGIVAAPLLAGDKLIVPVMSGTALSPPPTKCVLVVDRLNGTELWSLVKGSSVMHTPVTDGESVYFAIVSGYLSDTELLAHRLADGQEVWKRRLGGVADSSPLLSGQYLLFGNHDGNFYMVNAPDGTVAQTLPLGGKMFSSPALSGGRVYVGAQDGKVYCLKPR